MKEADHRQFWFRNNKFDLFYEKVPSLAANCDLDYHHRHRNAVSVYRKEPDGRARPVGPDSWLNRGWLVRLGSIYSKLPVKCPRQAAGSPPATRSLTWHSIRERCKMKKGFFSFQSSSRERDKWISQTRFLEFQVMQIWLGEDDPHMFKLHVLCREDTFINGRGLW